MLNSQYLNFIRCVLRPACLCFYLGEIRHFFRDHMWFIGPQDLSAKGNAKMSEVWTDISGCLGTSPLQPRDSSLLLTLPKRFSLKLVPPRGQATAFCWVRNLVSHISKQNNVNPARTVWRGCGCWTWAAAPVLPLLFRQICKYVPNMHQPRAIFNLVFQKHFSILSEVWGGGF